MLNIWTMDIAAPNPASDKPRSPRIDAPSGVSLPIWPAASTPDP
jgi:hypothetical protein